MTIRTHAITITALAAALLAACAPTTPPTTEPPSEQSETVEGPPVPQLPEPYDTRTLRTRSNVRAEPTTSAEIVGTFDDGTTIGLLDLERGWYQVRIDSTIGWVFAPLVNMTGPDRFMAAISYMNERHGHDELFGSQYQTDDGLTIILEMAWSDLTEAQKTQVVQDTGEAWQAACGRMGIEPPPTIHFMSNNEVEMARWHGFWGAKVFY